MKKRIFSYILLIFILKISIAQDTDFRSPMGFDMLLSGTFAELRGNHFHSGIDIKTRGTSGHPIYAIADGWVSRVLVGAYGFGHALYITHPSGHTSVYAHLDRFAGSIAEVVKNRQYSKESFSVEFYPERNAYPVKKGEMIGYSGNSGSSEGPHLHFEIRDAISQKPANALHYGYEVEDNIPPMLQRIRFYPVGENAAINGRKNPQSLYVFKSGVNIKPNTSRVEVSGNIAIGVQTYDKLTGAPNHNGPYRVTMFADSVKFWEFIADRFSFAETRYMNAMIDYASYQRDRHMYYQSYLKPGNRLSMIAVKDKGLLSFEPGQTKVIRIEVEDLAGNLSVAQFSLKGVEPPLQKNELKGKLFHYNQDNYFSSEGVKFSVPAGVLYDTLDFTYSVSDMPSWGYSKIHKLHNELVPMHKYGTVSVKVDRPVHNGLKNKLLLVRIDERGRKHEEGGYWNNGWLTAKTREMGRYVVMADTVKPVVRPLNIYEGKTISATETIAFRVSDDFSGVDYYRGEIDGKWVLFKYYPRQNRLVYEIDDRVSAGKHELVLAVADKRGNTTVYKTEFTIR